MKGILFQRRTSCFALRRGAVMCCRCGTGEVLLSASSRPSPCWSERPVLLTKFQSPRWRPEYQQQGSGARERANKVGTSVWQQGRGLCAQIPTGKPASAWTRRSTEAKPIPSRPTTRPAPSPLPSPPLLPSLSLAVGNPFSPNHMKRWGPTWATRQECRCPQHTQRTRSLSDNSNGCSFRM